MVLGWYDWLYDRKDNLSALLRGEYRRERSRDLERVASTAYSPSNLSSPQTLEEVDRLYGTRAYHGPQNSFSRPGPGPGPGSGTVTVTAPSPARAPTRTSTVTGSTVTTTISSSNTFDLKEFK